MKDHKLIASRSEDRWIYAYYKDADQIMGLDALKSFMKDNGYNYIGRGERACYLPKVEELYSCEAYMFEYDFSIAVMESNKMTRKLIWDKIPSSNTYEEGKTLIYVCQDAAQGYPGGWLEFQLYMYRNGYTYWKDKENVTCYSTVLFRSIEKVNGSYYHLIDPKTCYANVFYAN